MFTLVSVLALSLFLFVLAWMLALGFERASQGQPVTALGNAWVEWREAVLDDDGPLADDPESANSPSTPAAV